MSLEADLSDPIPEPHPPGLGHGPCPEAPFPNLARRNDPVGRKRLRLNGVQANAAPQPRLPPPDNQESSAAGDFALDYSGLQRREDYNQDFRPASGAVIVKTTWIAVPPSYVGGSISSASALASN
jgi:hypothetical protein